MQKNALIVGASGFLGQALSNRLSAIGFQVSGTYRSNNPRSVVQGIRYDFPGDDPAVNLAGCPADTVIITARLDDSAVAPWPNSALFEKKLVELVDFLKLLKGPLEETKIVYVSSDAVFSGSRGSYSENDQPDPLTQYGQMHVRAEEIIRQRCQASLIVRVSYLFGSYDGRLDKRLSRLQECMELNRPLPVSKELFKSPVDINDAAASITEAVLSGQTGFWHIPGQRMSVYEFYASGLRRMGGQAQEGNLLVLDNSAKFDTSLVSIRAHNLGHHDHEKPTVNA